MPDRRCLALSLLLAASCATGPVGTFEGAGDVGKGRLELRRDGSFFLDHEFAYDAIRWQASGQWRPGAADGLIELVVVDSKLSPPTDLGDGPTDHLPADTVLAAIVVGDSAFIVGAEAVLEMPRKR